MSDILRAGLGDTVTAAAAAAESMRMTGCGWESSTINRL